MTQKGQTTMTPPPNNSENGVEPPRVFQVLPLVLGVLTIVALSLGGNLWFYSELKQQLTTQAGTFETKEAATLRHELVLQKLESLSRDISRLSKDIEKLQKP